MIDPPAEGGAGGLNAGAYFCEPANQLLAVGIERDLPAGKVIGQTVE